jgi:hypothetical protein
MTDNAFDAINPSDYAGLCVKCLTLLQCSGPEGFAAREEKEAQGHCCRYQEYQLVVPLEG